MSLVIPVDVSVRLAAGWSLWVPSWNRSFMDKSLYPVILHRWCPLWTGASASFIEWQVTQHKVLSGPDSKLCTTVLDVPQCFSRQSPSSSCDNRYYNPVNGSLLPCSWVVGQLPKSELVTSSIQVKACGFTVDI